MVETEAGIGDLEGDGNGNGDEDGDGDETGDGNAYHSTYLHLIVCIVLVQQSCIWGDVLLLGRSYHSPRDTATAASTVGYKYYPAIGLLPDKHYTIPISSLVSISISIFISISISILAYH